MKRGKCGQEKFFFHFNFCVLLKITEIQFFGASMLHFKISKNWLVDFYFHMFYTLWLSSQM